MKVLLVDDHAVVRAGVRRLLESEAGISIVEAENSHDAVEVWRRERPNLIILDLNLTESSGLELLRRLIQLDKTAKILILSMHSEPVYAARALQSGARGYVSKSAGADGAARRERVGEQLLRLRELRDADVVGAR